MWQVRSRLQQNYKTVITMTDFNFEPISFYKIFSHHMATVNGVRLHYVKGGQGEPVVLLNGWPQTWYLWRKIMPALAEKYTVISVDVRGTGDSEKPETGYDAKNVAEDIYQLVRSLGFSTVNIVGYDITGRVAYAYAAAHREDVRRLVLMETMLSGFGLEQLMDVAKGGSWHFGFQAAGEVPVALITGRERLYIELMMRGSLYNHGAITEADLEEYVRCNRLPGGLRGGFAHYRAFLGDTEYFLECGKTKLEMPVLALSGAEGGNIGFPQTMSAVAENVTAELVEASGHFIAEERPDYLAPKFLSFFAD